MIASIGWDPKTPAEWIDHVGDKFEYRGGTLTPLLNDLRDRIGTILWQQAAEHHNGKGLQNGADIDQLKKHVKYYEDRQMHPVASLLHTVVAGGIWSGTRKAQANMRDANSLCPHCGEEQTDLHMIWTCSAYAESEHDDLKNSQNLAELGWIRISFRMQCVSSRFLTCLLF